MTEVRVYPALEYGNASTGANIAIQRLQGLLANPSAPLTSQNMPQVPYFNAASMMAAQTQRLHFQNGDGVRLVTQYGQGIMPITNNGTFYQFVGLTSDGKYLIIAVLPVQAPVLPKGPDVSSPLPAGGVPFPPLDSTDPKVFETYFQAVADKLNSTDPAAFQPSLASLDALVQSITVNP